MRSESFSLAATASSLNISDTTARKALLRDDPKLLSLTGEKVKGRWRVSRTEVDRGREWLAKKNQEPSSPEGLRTSIATALSAHGGKRWQEKQCTCRGDTCNYCLIHTALIDALRYVNRRVQTKRHGSERSFSR